MSDSVELVPIVTAPTPQGAENIAGILEAEGIPTVIEGRSLLDEWALTQRALGASGVTVKVRKQDFERAQAILAEATDSSAELESDS